MKRSFKLAIHLIFWVIYVAFTYMLCKIYLQAQPNAPFGQHLLYVVILELFMGLLFFYITFYGIQYVSRNKFNILYLSLLLIFLLFFFAYPALQIGFWEVMSSIIPHVIVILLAVVFRKFFDSIRLEKEKQTLMLQNTQSELALLKMQISPHFLFNTLNNIDYLIAVDKDKASNSISKLGKILRYMIYDAGVEKIPLSKELEHLKDYIELIRLRTSGFDYLVYNEIGDAGNLQIAPMLFLPLIENAYKHASVKEGENIINIRIEIGNDDIFFVIGNYYDRTFQNSFTQKGGLGLNIVKRRLELIYPDCHQFIVNTDNSYYTVEIKIKFDEN